MLNLNQGMKIKTIMRVDWQIQSENTKYRVWGAMGTLIVGLQLVQPLWKTV